MALSPHFQKLRNPILRKTIAKVATLRQVADAGGIGLAHLINTLRRATGLPDADVAEAGGAANPPAWLDRARIARRFDARPLIEKGERPMDAVLLEMEALPSGMLLEVTTPFPPAPLVDLAVKKGFSAWVCAESPQVVKTYFRKLP